MNSWCAVTIIGIWVAAAAMFFRWLDYMEKQHLPVSYMGWAVFLIILLGIATLFIVEFNSDNAIEE